MSGRNTKSLAQYEPKYRKIIETRITVESWKTYHTIAHAAEKLSREKIMYTTAETIVRQFYQP